MSVSVFQNTAVSVSKYRLSTTINLSSSPCWIAGFHHFGTSRQIHKSPCIAADVSHILAMQFIAVHLIFMAWLMSYTPCNLPQGKLTIHLPCSHSASVAYPGILMQNLLEIGHVSGNTINSTDLLL